MLNRIVLMGRLTRDPELRRTGSGTAVTSFTLAVDRDFKSQSGEKETDFIDIVVEGRLQIRDWTDKDGGKRRSAEVIADNVYFGDSKKDDQGSRPVSRGVDVSASDFAEISEEDGELPF